MSNSRHEPPEFCSDASGYAEYKRRLQRWSRITTVKKKQQAEVVVYHLEGHPSGIQDKIDTAIGDKIQDKEDGLEELLKYLDTIYAEDDMTTAWTSYKRFVRLVKSKEQQVTEFIADFEKEYKKAKECGCVFSDTVLAFCLLEACKLSDVDEKFVLTGIDFKVGKEKGDMLDQVKSSLRKFQSREKVSVESRSEDKMKVDESLVAGVKEALISEGWKPPRPGGRRRSYSDSDAGEFPRNSSNYKGKKNPLGSDGKPLRCFNCKSEYHMKDKCDKKEANQKEDAIDTKKKEKKEKEKKKKDAKPTMLTTLLKSKKDVEFTMLAEVKTWEKDELVLASHAEHELACLVEEAGVRGVLDCGCSKSVAGVKWLKKYTESLAEELAENLKVEESKRVYQFGGGETRCSQGCVSLPTLIGDKKVNINVEIVEAEIPLLIGSNSMQAAEAQLDFGSMKAVFFEEEIDMIKVGSGLFCIDLVASNIECHINNSEERYEAVEQALVMAENIDEKTLKKLHHIFGHTSADRLMKLLQKTGKLEAGTKAVLEKIKETCDACVKSAKKKPRPKSAIPRVDGPNQIVTIDLKEYEASDPRRRYICYFIDMHSRMTVAGFIPEKKPEHIVEVLMSTWVPHYGIMKGLHSDIGGEMSNDIMEDVVANLIIKPTTTAAYSPHQNGLNERNHATVDTMMLRMKESDPKLSPEMCLRWALHAKNSLDNCFGYSPFQLQIGYNPMLPSATRDGPSALEGITKSQALANHLNAMHTAREEFIKAEASSVLRKALKSKIHPRGEDIEEGDWIYYKKDDNKAKEKLFRGPAHVVATHGKKLFIDQGARLGTVNRDNAVKFGEEFWRAENFTDEIDESVEEEKNMEEKTSSESRTSGSEQEEESDISSEAESSSSSDDEDRQPNEEETSSSETSEIESQANLETEENQLENQTVNDIPADNNVDERPNDMQAMQTYSFRDIKQHDVIKYKFIDTDWSVATVVSRAGKSSGKNKYWWNVRSDETGKVKSLDTENFQDVEKIIDKEVEEVEEALAVVIPRHLHYQSPCIEAKEKELKNWEDFGVFEEVPDEGQKALGTNWVLVKKIIDSEEGVKARLCVRGDMEEEVETIRRDSPTVNKTNIKLFYLIAVHKKWKIRTADVKAAFLQGTDLDREVYLRPPKERRIPGVLWKMVKRAYGFVDASRGFYLELEETLKQLGCKVSKFDPALYYFFDEKNELKGMICTHVDDLMNGSGDETFEEKVMKPLKMKFQFGSEEESIFRYVGMQVAQHALSITVNFDHYVENIEVPSLEVIDDITGEDLLDEDSQSEFRSLVGKLGWLAKNARPDLGFDSLVMSTKVGKANANDFKQVVKLVKKLKAESSEMRFIDIGPVEDWTIVGHGDAGYRSLPDKVSSCGGQVISVMNKKTKAQCVVSWKSKKMKRVVSSSTAAEALAVNDTLDEMVYIKEVLKEALGDEANNIPLDLYTDSRNLYKSVMSTSLNENPRLRTDVAKLQESLKIGELQKINQISGQEILADCLTKKGASSELLRRILRRGRP